MVAAAAWLPFTVMVALRTALVVFLLTATVKVWLPLPLLCETVHHDWLELTVHVSLLVTVAVAFGEASAPKVMVVGLTVSVYVAGASPSRLPSEP